jgi:hypothetical protein
VNLGEKGACFQSRGHREVASIIVALDESSFPIKQHRWRSVRREKKRARTLSTAPHLRFAATRKLPGRLINDRLRPRDTPCSQLSFSPARFLTTNCFELLRSRSSTLFSFRVLEVSLSFTFRLINCLILQPMEVERE